MKVEILITADVIVFEDDDIECLKNEVTNEVIKSVKQFAGSKYNSTPYHENGVYDYLRHVDHEMGFNDEGEFQWKKKE